MFHANLIVSFVVKTFGGFRDFVGYGQPQGLPHAGQAQGQPVYLVSTPEFPKSHFWFAYPHNTPYDNKKGHPVMG
jgi:hypothetical protein